MLTDEVVVVEMRIPGINPGDFLELPGAERFIGIQAPDAFQQPLSPQHFVDAGNASAKSIGRVKKRRIAIGDLAISP